MIKPLARPLSSREKQTFFSFNKYPSPSANLNPTRTKGNLIKFFVHWPEDKWKDGKTPLEREILGHIKPGKALLQQGKQMFFHKKPLPKTNLNPTKTKKQLHKMKKIEERAE